MKLDEMKTLIPVLALAASMGAGCNTDRAQGMCEDYFGEGATVAEGACLPPGCATVEDLRKTCKGEVVKRNVVLCECLGTRGNVWQCVEPGKDDGK